MENKSKNSMQAKFETEVVELPSQLFIKLEGELIALTPYIKLNGELVRIEPQWK